ncbi:MAG: PIN domain-containing protein [Archaeoglobi archaeon]|nr:PIN domain-containing protein [Candidatus Mnemosynella bozhongmuii]
MRIFFDMNFLISLIVETELSERSKKVIENYIDLDFVTSISVIEETAFILRKNQHRRKTEKNFRRVGNFLSF